MANVDISKIIVAIDAGHGSNTAGKRTPDGYKEHWINVKCAYYCEQYLKSFGIKTFRVAWDDTNAKDDADVSLTTRQKQIKNKGCYLVVSFHANAYGSGWNNSKGVETLVHIVKAKRGNSVALAKDIQKQIIKGTEQTDRGVKYQSLAMCNCSAMKVKASALVEIGFMTNKHEAGLMKTDAFCKEQGEDVARGILVYLGVDYTKKPVKKEEPKKETETNKSFKSYKIKTTISSLNIRKSASVSSKVVGVITGNEKLVKQKPKYYYPNDIEYTIVEEKMNGKTKWGKLKSGIGYISLQYTKKV